MTKQTASPAKKSHCRNNGFSLLEIIVVIAIMAILGGVLTPQLMKHINNNRITACQVDREAILAVYERCIYAETQELKTANLANVLSGGDPLTKDEVLQYVDCPSGGHYTAEVIESESVAVIHCDHEGHEDVAVDFIGWKGNELAEGIDTPITPPPPLPDEPDTEPPSSEEETSSEEPPSSSGFWPYEDDPRWDGKRFPGQYIEVDVPSGLFTSKEGNTYVFVDRSGGSGKFRIYYEWSLGPEQIDTQRWEQCISWSGVIIEDIESIRHPNSPSQITGVNYGDILIYQGYRYIYGSFYGTNMENAYQDLPIPGQNGNNFYLVDPIK